MGGGWAAAFCADLVGRCGTDEGALESTGGGWKTMCFGATCTVEEGLWGATTGRTKLAVVEGGGLCMEGSGRGAVGSGWAMDMASKLA